MITENSFSWGRFWFRCGHKLSLISLWRKVVFDFVVEKSCLWFRCGGKLPLISLWRKVAFEFVVEKSCLWFRCGGKLPLISLWRKVAFDFVVEKSCLWFRCGEKLSLISLWRKVVLISLWRKVVFDFVVEKSCLWFCCGEKLPLISLWRKVAFDFVVEKSCLWFDCGEKLSLKNWWEWAESYAPGSGRGHRSLTTGGGDERKWPLPCQPWTHTDNTWVQLMKCFLFCFILPPHEPYSPLLKNRKLSLNLRRNLRFLTPPPNHPNLRTERILRLTVVFSSPIRTLLPLCLSDVFRGAI